MDEEGKGGGGEGRRRREVGRGGLEIGVWMGRKTAGESPQPDCRFCCCYDHLLGLEKIID